MIEINWEAFGVLLTIALACLAGITLLVKLFWGWRTASVISQQEKMMKAILVVELAGTVSRIKQLELDVKESATKNMEMSQAFHSEISKILYLFTEREK